MRTDYGLEKLQMSPLSNFLRAKAESIRLKLVSQNLSSYVDCAYTQRGFAI